jgi:ribosomal protein S18 acetylase RimI-like enzyme
VSGTPVGVVWALYLPSDDQGYGYLDDRTPEPSVWVAPDRRGRGLGRELLVRMQDKARRCEVAAVSLSVEPDNFAKALYHSVGFTEVSGREADGVMVWRV